MSSLSPLAGRLSQIFDPRNCACVSGLIFAVGSLMASQAHDFWFFLFGRAVQGMGAAGIYTLSINLVIYLADKKRRGLFIGGANSGITLGVSLGAVIGGEFVTSIGWVGCLQRSEALLTETAALVLASSPHRIG
jgi:MFS family permease